MKTKKTTPKMENKTKKDIFAGQWSGMLCVLK